MESPIKDDGSELNDSEIDEWAEIDEVGEVISGSDGSKEEAFDSESKNAQPAGQQPALKPSETVKVAAAPILPVVPKKTLPATEAAKLSTAVPSSSTVRVPAGANSVPSASPSVSTHVGSVSGSIHAGLKTLPAASLETKKSTVHTSVVGDVAGSGTALQAPSSVEIDEDTPQESPIGQQEGGTLWGGWGKWNIGASLQQAVGSAMKDVQELGTSFQQVLTELADDAEVEEVDDSEAIAEPPLADDADPGELEKKRDILERLRGPDTALQSGLKTVDTQVEQATTGAFKTIGTWFGGAVNYSQTLATKVEEAARLAAKEIKETVEEGVKDIASLPAVQAASSGLAAAPTRAASILRRNENFTLEKLGKTAVAFLENNMGLVEGSDDDQFGGEALSFDQCFYIYGGHQSLEELEALSNECARSVNRVRSRITDDKKTVLDQAMAQLSPYFTFQDTMPAESDEAVDASPMGQGHAVISELCQAGLQRVGELAQLAAKEASHLAEQPEAESTPDDSSGVSPEAKAQHAEQFVVSVQQEGVKKMAELCSLCVERLLALGRSVSAQFRYGKPADDGIQWPPASTDKAKLIRQQAFRMLTDVKVLSAAYKDCLDKVHSSFESKLKLTLSQVAESLTAGWDNDQDTATCKLQDGFRGLLYIVLLTTVDRDWLQA